jgi:hypothetical protein
MFRTAITAARVTVGTWSFPDFTVFIPPPSLTTCLGLCVHRPAINHRAADTTYYVVQDPPLEDECYRQENDIKCQEDDESVVPICLFASMW